MITRNLRIQSIRPLISPDILLEEFPLSEEGSVLVTKARKTIHDILERKDDRLLVVVGPCSIHDPKAAMDYTQRLKKLAQEVEEELF